MITYVAVSWIGRSFYFNNIARELMPHDHRGRDRHAADQALPRADGDDVRGRRRVRLPPADVHPADHGGDRAAVRHRRPAGPVLYGWTFLSFCLALVIYSQINFLLGCLAFHMKNIQGVLRAKMVSMDFLTGVVVPFTFFPDWFQQVVDWLPFQGISYIPVTIYLGKRPGDEL